MTSRKKIRAGHFHVVGGGCFGSQYVRWLLRARKLGWLEFTKIYVIDRNPHCLWRQEGNGDPGVEVINEDWVKYFSLWLIKNSRGISDPILAEDHWVPAPLSPHILFEGFLRAAQSVHGDLVGSERPFRETVGTPVTIPLAHGPLAVSFAEWQCPVNCIEPATCPAIHQKRHWDMKQQLQRHFSNQQPDVSWHVLQCRHLLHGVGTIPLNRIRQEYLKFLDKLAERRPVDLIVATVSGCHGLIGKAAITWNKKTKVAV